MHGETIKLKKKGLILYKLASVPIILYDSEMWTKGIKNTRKIQETNVVLLWNATPCILVDNCRRFWATCYASSTV